MLALKVLLQVVVLTLEAFALPTLLALQMVSRWFQCETRMWMKTLRSLTKNISMLALAKTFQLGVALAFRETLRLWMPMMFALAKTFQLVMALASCMTLQLSIPMLEALTLTGSTSWCTCHDTTLVR